jgi:hypothetical protein
MGRVLRTSHTSIIFSATPIAFFKNGTGMTSAADCNSARACFPVAVIYSDVVGTTDEEFPADF